MALLAMFAPCGISAPTICRFRHSDWQFVCDNASGVDGITAGKTVTKEVYYNVQGVEVLAPAPGMSAVYMVVRTYDDGTTETVKVIK